MKKRILVIYTSSVISPLAQPHGAAIICNILEKAGFEMKLVCPFWKSNNENSLQDDLEKFQPDLIAISIRNHGTAGFDYRTTAERTFCPEAKRIISVCSLLSDAPIVLGGSGFSVDPQRYIEIKGVSVGFVGNAEWDLEKFAVRLLREGKNTEDSIAGITSVVLPGKTIVPILPSDIEPGSYNFAFCSEGIKAALAVGGTIPFRTKTGCDGNCIYCVMPLIERRNFRSSQSVVDEIRIAEECNLGNRLFCADSEFGQDLEHDKAVCHSIIQSGLGKKIRINGYGDPFFMSKNMTDLMWKAGWREISLSVDSFSPKIRKIYRKKGSVADVEEGIINTINAGIGVTLNILLGGPGETLDSISETLEVLKKFREKVSICFTFGLTIFPYTPLQKISKQGEHSEYLHKENGAFLASYCSPCLPMEMVAFLEKTGFSPARNNNVIFWNEEADNNEVEFCKKIMQIANGSKELTLEPKSELQQLMLETANLVGRRG